MAMQPGDRLGPYEVQSPIGAGGMGEVYRARDTRLDRTVAIKVLPDHIAQREGSRARFEREARAVASLSHPNICSLFDIGEGYMVMELIDGETLAQRDQKMKKVAVDGGAAVTLCDASWGYGASWGDDGNIIAALRDTLSRVPSEGGTPVAVTTLNAGEATHRWARPPTVAAPHPLNRRCQGMRGLGGVGFGAHRETVSARSQAGSRAKIQPGPRGVDEEVVLDVFTSPAWPGRADSATTYGAGSPSRPSGWSSTAGACLNSIPCRS